MQAYTLLPLDKSAALFTRAGALERVLHANDTLRERADQRTKQFHSDTVQSQRRALQAVERRARGCAVVRLLVLPVVSIK